MAETPLPTVQNAPRRWPANASAWLWAWLRRPWLAIVAGALAIILSLAGWLLPQLPGQLVDEQAAAAAWFVTTSTTYGIWGNALLALGLFDVLRSPLLYLLLALLVPTLAAQLADQIGALHQQQTLPALVLSSPIHDRAGAVEVPAVRPIYRWRGLVAAPVTQAIHAAEAALPAGFTTAGRVQLPIPALHDTQPATLPETLPEALLETSRDADATFTEIRLLALRHPHLQYIRPLLMIGLLVCVAGAWIALAFGWHITAPPLAPGAVFRSANRDFVMHYAVPLTATHDAMLQTRLQDVKMTLPVDSVARVRIGAATIRLRPSFPAVWITTTDGTEQITLPGETILRDHVGLVFATPGSEESILIPDLRAGLRIVQRAGSSGFVLELYRSDTVQPVYRAELTSGGQLTIPFAESSSELKISSLPGLQVDVRQLPGLWLIPLGILLTLIGATAYARPGGFLIMQAAAWQEDQSVVILQSDHADLIADLPNALATLAPRRDE